MGWHGHASPADRAHVQALERQAGSGGLTEDEELELALLYVEPLHEEDKAIARLEDLVSKGASGWQARIWLAYLYLHHRMDRSSLLAGREILSPLVTVPGEPAAAALLLLSSISRDLGELDTPGEAALLERSVQQAPTWALNRFLLAGCYRQLGQKEDALRELQQAEANLRTVEPPHTKLEEEFEVSITVSSYGSSRNDLPGACTMTSTRLGRM